MVEGSGARAPICRTVFRFAAHSGHLRFPAALFRCDLLVSFSRNVFPHSLQLVWILPEEACCARSRVFTSSCLQLRQRFVR